MDEITVADIEQLFCGTLVLYKDQPVLFKSISQDRQARLLNLFHGKEVRVKFELKDFGAPRGRIGFVNHGGSAAYIFRKPRRQFAVGVTNANADVKVLPYLNNDRRSMIYKELKEFNNKAIHNAMVNDYPKFSEALERAKESGGACAFDKQFAIGYDNVIWYKQARVGVLPEGKKSMKDIVFDKGFEYLKLPLLQEHGKVERTFEG